MKVILSVSYITANLKLQITQPSQYIWTQLQYRFAVISEAPSISYFSLSIMYCTVLCYQVLEMYSSGGDLHLELPTGETEADKQVQSTPRVNAV